jgi:hypothetical protein
MVRYAAETGSELSCGDAAGMTLMTETAAPVAKPVVVMHLSGMAARCSNDLIVRRKIDTVVYEIRKEMAKVALEMADKNGEPPLEQQAAN